MIIVSNSNWVSVTIFFGLSLGHIFDKMYKATKGAWPSDIAKEQFKTNLKVHCIIKLSLSHKVFRWHPGITGNS